MEEFGFDLKNVLIGDQDLIAKSAFVIVIPYFFFAVFVDSSACYLFFNTQFMWHQHLECMPFV